MAEILEGFDFTKPQRTAKYPYDEWFNGQVWKLKHGVDFEITAKNMQINLYSAASRYDLKLQTKLIGDELIIQAVEWDEEES